MHPTEYERYLCLKRPYTQQTELLPLFQPINFPQPTPLDMDVQQSVVSTIKSEYFGLLAYTSIFNETFALIEFNYYFKNLHKKFLEYF